MRKIHDVKRFMARDKCYGTFDINPHKNML